MTIKWRKRLSDALFYAAIACGVVSAKPNAWSLLAGLGVLLSYISGTMWMDALNDQTAARLEAIKRMGEIK